MLAPYDRHMGFTVVASSPEGVVLSLDAGPHLANPTGALHGGVLAGIADSAMGLTLSLRWPGRACANMDLHMRFLAPVRDGRLTATARVVKEGRRTLATAADVHEGERLVAVASSTFLDLTTAQADGSPGPAHAWSERVPADA